MPFCARYYELHLSLHAHVQIWLVPMTPWCPLLMARLVLWRRYGIVAALLPGPPAGVFHRSNGIHECDRDRLADHVRNLANHGYHSQLWPRTGKIVFTGCSAYEMVPVKMAIPNYDSTDRLVPFPHSLSERRSTTRWRRNLFLANPDSNADFHQCILTQRCHQLLIDCGYNPPPAIANEGYLGEMTNKGKAFRKLYSGAK